MYLIHDTCCRQHVSDTFYRRHVEGYMSPVSDTCSMLHVASVYRALENERYKRWKLLWGCHWAHELGLHCKFWTCCSCCRQSVQGSQPKVFQVLGMLSWCMKIITVKLWGPRAQRPWHECATCAIHGLHFSDQQLSYLTASEWRVTWWPSGQCVRPVLGAVENN